MSLVLALLIALTTFVLIPQRTLECKEETDLMSKSYYKFPRTKCQQWFLEYCLKDFLLIAS